MAAQKLPSPVFFEPPASLPPHHGSASGSGVQDEASPFAPVRAFRWAAVAALLGVACGDSKPLPDEKKLGDGVTVFRDPANHVTCWRTTEWGTSGTVSVALTCLRAEPSSAVDEGGR